MPHTASVITVLQSQHTSPQGSFGIAKPAIAPSPVATLLQQNHAAPSTPSTHSAPSYHCPQPPNPIAKPVIPAATPLDCNQSTQSHFNETAQSTTTQHGAFLHPQQPQASAPAPSQPSPISIDKPIERAPSSPGPATAGLAPIPPPRSNALLIELDAGYLSLPCLRRCPGLDEGCRTAIPGGANPACSTTGHNQASCGKRKPPCAAMRTASQRVMACIPFNNACHSWPQLVATRRVAILETTQESQG